MNHIASLNHQLLKRSFSGRRRSNRGVVLIVALILLVVISLLAVTSLRNAGSAESAAGNVRTTEMATQAAELALRYCETTLTSLISIPPSTATLIISTTGYPLWSAKDTTTNAMTNWDGTSTTANVLPIALVNETSMTQTFQRPPECMVEAQPVWVGSTVNSSFSYVITARGFGPEVAAADAARTRPAGTEVWLQSTVQRQ